MGDLKSKIPDLNELGSMASKLFKGIKSSIDEIIVDYKRNHPNEPVVEKVEEKVEIKKEEVNGEVKTEVKTEVKAEVKPEEPKDETKL